MLQAKGANQPPPYRPPPAGPAGAVGACASCVIVTYLPAHEPLLRLLEAIRPQVDNIVLVDNGDGSALPAIAPALNVEIITLGGNKGLAHAQNIGIQRARWHGAERILLLDQDSLPATDMVAQLLDALAQLEQLGTAVAAVGPQYRDERQGTVSPFVYRDGLALKECPATPPGHPVPTDFLIASGSLIPAVALDAVGDMDETLFIDYVDIEWCLRAKRFGYGSFGVPAAQLTHSLGDDWILFRGRRFPIHNPTRHYYYARNAILLASRAYIDPPWKFILLWRLPKQLILFGLLVPGGRAKHFGMMMLGFWHGITQRRGPL